MLGSEEQINALTALLADLIRVGVVTSTDDSAGSARVQFRDRTGVVSYDLQVVVRNSRVNHDYWMPDINEQVLCLFLPSGVETGYILGSFYSDVTTPPASTKDKRRVEFGDGAYAEYDRATKTLTGYTPGDALLQADGDATVTIGKNLTATAVETANVTAPIINLTGIVNIAGALNLLGPMTAAPGLKGAGVSIEGNVAVTGGDVTADSVSVKGHTHKENGGETDPPTQ